MSTITMNAHLCNRNWGKNVEEFLTTIAELFDDVSHSVTEDGNITHMSVNCRVTTEGVVTVVDDSLDGDLINLLGEMVTDYVPYNVTVTAVNDDTVDVTYLLDSTKKFVAVNGSGDDLFECSARPLHPQL